MPPEETFTTRDGAPARSAGSSSAVSRNGPSTLVAKLSSKPSPVWVRSAGIAPALLTSTCSSGLSATKPVANSRTAAMLETSQISRRTRSEPVRSEICASARSPLSRFRTTMCTVAPPRASCSAAAAPMPELAPVIITLHPSRPALRRGHDRCRIE